MLQPAISSTKFGESCVVLLAEDAKTIVLKAYPNADGTKLRIVLPELVSFKQAKIDIDNHMIEFERSVLHGKL